jgi:hypothetical protein
VVGFTTGSRGEIPGKKERKPVTRNDDDDNNNIEMFTTKVGTAYNASK